MGWVSQVFGPRWGLAVGGVATVGAVLFFGTAFVRAQRRVRTRRAPGADVVRGADGEVIPAAIS